MDPCQFVRVLVGNLALKIPMASRPAGSGVHPSSSPCYCKIRLNKLPYQTAPVTLIPTGSAGDQIPQTLTLAASFDLAQSDLDKLPESSKLTVSVYTGRRGSTCGVSSGRLLGKLTLPIDLKGAQGQVCVFHNGWASMGKQSKTLSAVLHLTVRSELDPRFVFEFDGEPECSPQVFQVHGAMRQPVFTCKFSCRSSGDRHLRTRSWESEANTPRSWLSSFGSDRERPLKERKGWTITVHDLSGSMVAMASMATPFVPSPGTDRVSRSNPGAWLILRPGDSTWKPWGRLQAWRERGDDLGYRFDLLPDASNPNGVGISLAESTLSMRKGGDFTIDLTRGWASPMNSPRGSGEWGMWALMGHRGMVMSSMVGGEGKCSKPVLEIGVQHVGCAEDAAAFVALAAAVDLSMDACKLFSQKLREELLQPQQQGGSFI